MPCATTSSGLAVAAARQAAAASNVANLRAAYGLLRRIGATIHGGLGALMGAVLRALEDLRDPRGRAADDGRAGADPQSRIAACRAPPRLRCPLCVAIIDSGVYRFCCRLGGVGCGFNRPAE